MRVRPGDVFRDKSLLRRLWGALPALVLVFLVVAVVILFGWIGAEKERLQKEKLAGMKGERPPVNVVLLAARPGPVRDRLTLPAVVEAWVELQVLAEVEGKVVSVPAREGDSVSKGDVIARIDRRDYENAVASLRASHELAVKTLTRMQNLFDEEIVPRSRLDEAQASADTLRAELMNAELRLERTDIRAPLSGTVNRMDAEEGLFLKLHDPVAVILETGRVKVAVGIPESDVDAVRDIEAFELTVEALGGRRFTGRKHFLASAPESLAHLYRLEIEVKNPRGDLLPGMFATVGIIKKEVREALSVPLYAVIARDGRNYVFVEKDGRAEMRPVETGILDKWQIEVTRGLSPGDRVVVVGHRSLGEGQRLNVIRSISRPEELYQ